MKLVSDRTPQQVEVQILDQTKCQGYYTYPITSAMFCAGWPGGKKDSCQVINKLNNLEFGIFEPAVFVVFSRVTPVVRSPWSVPVTTSWWAWYLGGLGAPWQSSPECTPMCHVRIHIVSLLVEC